MITIGRRASTEPRLLSVDAVMGGSVGRLSSLLVDFALLNVDEVAQELGIVLAQVSVK